MSLHTIRRLFEHHSALRGREPHNRRSTRRVLRTGVRHAVEGRAVERYKRIASLR